MGTPKHGPAFDLEIEKLAALKQWIVRKLRELYDVRILLDGTKAKDDVDEKLRLFASNFDICALYRFWTWAIAEQKKEPAEAEGGRFPDGWILSQIMHDLNGCAAGERFFDPRTSRY